MDSVLSSGQNEQGVSSIDRQAPETLIDNEDELNVGHQNLLFGANGATTSGSTVESGEISAVARVGGTVQRARDNSADLNLVAITGINSALEKTAKTGTPAANNDSNPLPAMARTGIATTVALQSPSAESVIPSGRRSGAADKIAIQLTEDSTPRPLIPTGLRLSEMDPVTRHNVAKASANLLFTQLATDVPGSADTRPAPVVSAALNRRKSGEPSGGAENSDNATVSPTPSNAYRPVTDTRPVNDTRTIVDGRLTDDRQNQAILPVARGTVYKGLVGEVTALPDALGTTYGAKPRTTADPSVNQDSPASGAKQRSTVETANTPEIPAGQRATTRTAGEGFATGAMTATASGSARNLTESQDVSPIPARIPTRAVSDAAFVLVGSGVQAAGDLPAVLPPMRKSPTGADQANISPVPNPPNTKGYPVQADRQIAVARTFDPYAGTPTPQMVPELIALRNPRSHRDETLDATGITGARSGEMSRDRAIPPAVSGDRCANSDKISPLLKPAGTNADTPVAAPAGRNTRQTLLSMLNTTSEQLATNVLKNGIADRIATNLDLPLTGGQTRRELQTPAQTQVNAPVIKDGQVFTAAARPGSDAVNSPAPLSTSIRSDGPGGRTADGPRGTLLDAGGQLGTGINRVVSGTTDLANTTARNLETSLPRTDRTRADQPAVSAPGSVIRDASVPAVHGLPLNARHGETLPTARVNINEGTVPTDKVARPLESVLGTERTAIKLVDATAVVGSNLPGNLAKNGDPVLAGDKATAKTADGRIAIDAARPAESTPRGGESIVRPEASVARVGEAIARAGDTTGRAGEATGRVGENLRSADGAAKAGGESVVSKNDAVVKSAESTAKATDGIAKSSETGIKVADSNGKAGEGGKVTDIAARSVIQQVKAAGDAAPVSARPAEVASRAGSEAAPVQKVLDSTARIGNDQVVKTSDAVVRDQNMVARSQDVIANSQMATADRGARLSDLIVRVADQAVKAPEVNQPVKLDGIARVTEQTAQNNQNHNQPVKLDATMQNNQMQASNQQPVKIDAVRIDANATTKAGEQNPIVAQNQLGMQNQIAQNQNVAMAGRANEQVVAQGVRADAPVPAQKAPINNIDNVKVDQVVADILNHVRNAGKDQQAGAKILNSLEQSNIAANQQLDPKGLLDAAAVRRILDGQGIAINPATLNTIMEGIRPTGEHAVDYALPSIGSLNLSQIISLGERLQEAVAGAGSETSEPQPKPQLQQHRTKYLVKEGDTLESIAQEKLGDARLVQLLITINRALVNYRLEGERKVAYVVPNQYLWLPTDHELDVHKKNFFGKQGKDGSVSLGISSKQNTPLIAPVSFDRTIEVSAEVSASMEDFRPGSGSSQPLSGNRISAGYEVKKYVPSFGSASGSRSGAVSGSESGSANYSTGDSKDNQMAGNLNKVRHAGNRKSVNLDEFEYASTQVSHRQCYQVREGETLMSIAASLESMGHISMWKLLARINGFQIEEGGLGKSIENLFQGQFIVLPTTEELSEFKLMDKLNSCTSSSSMGEGSAKNAFFCVQEQKKIEIPPPPALVALAQGIGGVTTVHKLSSYTRLVLNDVPQLENCFSITVETRWNGQWKPMASYECRHGQTTRHLYNKQGEIRSMELDLPPYVVKEMAREDFIRNWNAYVNSFMGEAVERFV